MHRSKHRITCSNRFCPNFLADKRSKSRSISISQTRQQGNVFNRPSRWKNSYGSLVIALSSLGYIWSRDLKIVIKGRRTRFINSIDTRKFHGDDLQKPIPATTFVFCSFLQIRIGESKRGVAMQKWRQKCPDFSIAIVVVID